MKALKCAAFLLALATLVGCSGKVKVAGTVVFSDDSTPVESGKICFISKAGDFQAGGSIVNGQFSVTSVKENDGLPKGEYDVYFTGIETVVKEGETLANGETKDPETMIAIDLKYLSASTSGISQTIDKPVKNLEFKLDRNPNLPK